ncbi:MAG: pilus assembly protein [Verrucomicrobia bacterium]|nr:MAG: pilus assembly protein [Verrucomicrobiota bacterium]
MTGIADTGFLVAFANSRDLYHDWALAVAEQISEPLLTCEAVLAETAFYLRDTALALQMIDDGLIVSSFNVNENLPQLHALARRYKDRTPDLADLCLVRLSELHPKLNVITTDVADFRIYRRNKREVIPLISPTRKK